MKHQEGNGGQHITHMYENIIIKLVIHVTVCKQHSSPSWVLHFLPALSSPCVWVASAGPCHPWTPLQAGLVLRCLPGCFADKAPLPTHRTQTLGPSSGLCFLTNLRKIKLTRSHGQASSNEKGLFTKDKSSCLGVFLGHTGVLSELPSPRSAPQGMADVSTGPQRLPSPHRDLFGLEAPVGRAFFFCSASAYPRGLGQHCL